MKFNKDILICALILLVFLLLWHPFAQWMGWEPKAAATKASVSAAVKAPAPTVKPAVQPAVPLSNAKVSEPAVKPAVISSPQTTVVVSPQSGGVEKIIFQDFFNNDRSAKLFLAAGINERQLFGLSLPDNWQSVAGSFEARNLDAGNVELVREMVNQAGDKIKIIQKITLLPRAYCLRSEYTFRNLSKHDVVIGEMILPGAALPSWEVLSGDTVRSESHDYGFLTAAGKFDDEKVSGDKENLSAPVPVKWAAVGNKYFCAVLKGENDFQMCRFRTKLANTGKKSDKNYSASAGAWIPAFSLPAESDAAMAFSAYIGPKNPDDLNGFVPQGSKIMQWSFGPLNYLARFLLWILRLFEGVCGSFGISIILLTILVRLLFFPLTAKSNESMQKMQRIQPKFKELKEKYKDNPQLLNQKMTELYRQEKVNPLSGCLPILLQIPIFFALYAMLDNTVALRHVSFLWCRDLAAADTVCAIGPIPVNPLMLLMTALMLVQQFLTPMATTDKSQRLMMYMMPVIMLFFLYSLPSGLTLYWTVSNLCSILQLLYQRRAKKAANAAQA